MSFLSKLFGPKKAPEVISRGAAPVQSQDEQDAIRQRMESEVAAQHAARATKASESAAKPE